MIHLLEMVNSYRYSILALLETHTCSSCTTTLLDKSYFTNFIAVEACGFARGILLF